MNSFSSSHPELVSGSIVGPARSKRFKTQAHSKVAPFGVGRVDQVDLPFTMPVLELFFARNGPLHVTEHLEMNQPMNLVARGKARWGTVPVLPEALHEVGRHTDVDRAVVAAGKDVDARIPLIRHGSLHAARWMLKQVQHDDSGPDNSEALRS